MVADEALLVEAEGVTGGPERGYHGACHKVQLAAHPAFAARQAREQLVQLRLRAERLQHQLQRATAGADQTAGLFGARRSTAAWGAAGSKPGAVARRIVLDAAARDRTSRTPSARSATTETHRARRRTQVRVMVPSTTAQPASRHSQAVRSDKINVVHAATLPGCLALRGGFRP